MHKLIVLLLALLPAPGIAGITPEALRALIVSADTAAVQAALAEAVAQDEKSNTEFVEQRDLFGVFVAADPMIDTFTANWLQDDPTSVFAMTARARYLFAIGWALRGEDVALHVYPAALAAMQEKHTEAFALVTAASTTMPELIAASDTMMRLTVTLGNIDVIPLELERVFALRPNRGSLMRAMIAVAPQWGGRYDQLNLLCDRYAPQIKTIANYDPDTCKIDGVYFGNFWNGDQREAAHQVLMWNANPILDYARLIDAVDGFGPPQQRLAMLTKLQSERALSVNEAMAFDTATAEIKGPGALIEPVEVSKSRSAEILARRLAADRKPYDPVIVIGYVNAVSGSVSEADQTALQNELKQRLRLLLKGAPYSGAAWKTLGNLIAGDPRDLDGKLDRLEAAEPYLINGAVYSVFDADAVFSLMYHKTMAILDVKDQSRQADISALSRADLDRLDKIVHCPLVWQLEALRLICTSIYADDNANSCQGHQWEQYLIVDRIQDAMRDRDACRTSSMGAEGLMQMQPIKIDP